MVELVRMTTESGWTAGLWHVTYGRRDNLCVVADTAWICGELANQADMSADEAQANARLIAAAPELYAALRAMVDWWNEDGGSMDGCIRTAEAALAKAEGRT